MHFLGRQPRLFNLNGGHVFDCRRNINRKRDARPLLSTKSTFRIEMHSKLNLGLQKS